MVTAGSGARYCGCGWLDGFRSGSRGFLGRRVACPVPGVLRRGRRLRRGSAAGLHHLVSLRRGKRARIGVGSGSAFDRARDHLCGVQARSPRALSARIVDHAFLIQGGVASRPIILAFESSFECGDCLLSEERMFVCRFVRISIPGPPHDTGRTWACVICRTTEPRSSRRAFVIRIRGGAADLDRGCICECKLRVIPHSVHLARALSVIFQPTDAGNFQSNTGFSFYPSGSP